MWSRENIAVRWLRLAAAFAVAASVAGCFQPLYGEQSVAGGPGVRDALAGVEIVPISAPNGSRAARLAVELQNALAFRLTGGGPRTPTTHRLDIKLSTSTSQVIVDVQTARPEIANYGIDVAYTLVDIATNKPTLTGTAFARVSVDIPGQQQRFAQTRGLRDAEDRAARVIAEQIQSRLASYFVAPG